MTEDRGGGPLDFDPDEERRARDELDFEPEEEPKPESASRVKPGRLGPRPTVRAPGAFQYGWVVGVAFLVVIILVTINTFRNGPGGSAGLTVGTPLPPFAMPLALSTLDGDADVARETGQGKAGKIPACDLRGSRILNSCELSESGQPVVLAFYAARSGSACNRELDRIEVARTKYPKIRFAAVAIRGNRGDLKREIRKRGWHFPVGYDRDGAVANIYKVAVCPTLTFARPGGIVDRTTVGELNTAKLAVRLRALQAEE